jgi:hypothetical protein
MKVHLRFLRDADIGREALERAGWLLERDIDNSVWAMHPQVRDESAARLRLHNVGLLTACSVSIEFVKRAACDHSRRLRYRRQDPTSILNRGRHLGFAD